MTLSLTGAAFWVVWWFLVTAVAVGAVLGSLVVTLVGWAGEIVVESVEVRRASRASVGGSGARNAAAGNANRR